jgi:phosphopantothenoylcysteine decarboxylase/phosphopantothenate--cysteine ligase
VLKGKNIILGVTGSIAAYKSVSLVRLLVKAGAQVKVVMTPASKEFITPLTLATLSKNEVHSDFTEDLEAGTWVNHVELGLWADLMIVAPLSANTLSKMAHGQSDNFLVAVYLSAKCPVMVAPAMDLDMFKHPSTNENLDLLLKHGDQVVDAGTGELASGLEGKGRMAEPEEIYEVVASFFGEGQPLSGKKVLVNAGPTIEKIDPVRFISNFSTGKMGLAVANECVTQGAEVTLVAGPGVPASDAAINRIDIESAKEMYDACIEHFNNADIGVMAAAVADYRPSDPSDSKIKKSSDSMSISLEKNPDILKTLGSKKSSNQILVGFALETDNEKDHALEKLKAKNLDFIVLNSLKDDGAGFGHDTNKVSLLFSNNKILSFELKTKAAVAKDIVQQIIELCGN